MLPSPKFEVWDPKNTVDHKMKNLYAYMHTLKNFEKMIEEFDSVKANTEYPQNVKRRKLKECLERLCSSYPEDIQIDDSTAKIPDNIRNSLREVAIAVCENQRNNPKNKRGNGPKKGRGNRRERNQGNGLDGGKRSGKAQGAAAVDSRSETKGQED